MSDDPQNATPQDQTPVPDASDSDRPGPGTDDDRGRREIVPAGLFAAAAALLLLWGLASTVGPPWVFFHIPSIVFVVGWTVAIGVITYGWRPFVAGVRGVGVLFTGHPPGWRSTATASVLRSCRRNLYAGGALGVVIGVVQVLANIGDPSTIGPGLSAALFSLFTALVLAELFFRPAIERLAGDGVGPT